MLAETAVLFCAFLSPFHGSAIPIIKPGRQSRKSGHQSAADPKHKYDLINWIFDTEFMALIKDEDLNVDYGKHWHLVEKACDYFYANHNFYRKALQIKGQNSFSDHFREYIQPLLCNRLSYVFGPNNVDEFALGFFADAVVCAMERWLLAKNCISSSEFVGKIKYLTEKSVTSIYQEMAEPQNNEVQ